MKKLFISIIIVIVSIFNIQAQEKIKIAVMDFTAGDGVKESMVKGLSETLANSMSETDKFTVVEREQFYKVIKEQEAKEKEIKQSQSSSQLYKMMEQEPKQSQLSVKLISDAGKIFGIKSVLVSSISYSKKSKKYSLDISIIDVENSQVIYTIGVIRNEGEVSNRTYRKLMPELAKKLRWKLISPSMESSVENVVVKPEKMPIFSGGERALNQYLSQNIKYPVAAMEKGIQGRVICQFVIKDDGSIVDIVVVRSVDVSTILDQEAIRVILNMPKWEPGMQDGKPVNVRYTLPINFRMQ